MTEAHRAQHLHGALRAAAADLTAFGFGNRRLEIVGFTARREPGSTQHCQRRRLYVGFQFEQGLFGRTAIAATRVPLDRDPLFRKAVARVTERAERLADAASGDSRTRRIESLEHALVRRGA